VTSAVTLPVPPGALEGWVQGSAKTDLRSERTLEGEIRISSSGGSAAVTSLGRLSNTRTENTTALIMLGCAELEIAQTSPDFEGWLDAGLVQFIGSTKPVQVQWAGGIASLSAQFADTSWLTIVGPQYLGLSGVVNSEVTQSIAPWLDDLTSRIYRFSVLPENWDSYRAKPISGDAIRKATRLASLFAHVISRAWGWPGGPPFVGPTSSGGVSFEMKNGSRELFIEIPPGLKDEYGILRVWRDASGREAEEEYNINGSQVREVLSWIAGNS
jgi:hypothetical protein